jgi:hypothetical protein
MSSPPKFYFDIETAPIMQLVEATYNPPRQPFIDKELDLTQWKTDAARQRNQEQWSADLPLRVRKHEEKENERWQKHEDRATLRPEMSSVLCISSFGGALSLDRPTVDWTASFGDECSLLRSLWRDCLHVQQRDGLIFSASGTQFDVRFCYRRSIALGLRLPPGLQVYDLSRGSPPKLHRSFVDVSEVWNAGERGGKISVDALATGLGIDGKETASGVTGANFWRMVQEHGREHCEPYAIRDVEIVYEIAQRMLSCGLFAERGDMEKLRACIFGNG